MLYGVLLLLLLLLCCCCTAPASAVMCRDGQQTLSTVASLFSETANRGQKNREQPYITEGRHSQPKWHRSVPINRYI
jgi:hypothetical protein